MNQVPEEADAQFINETAETLPQAPGGMVTKGIEGIGGMVTKGIEGASVGPAAREASAPQLAMIRSPYVFNLVKYID